MAKAKRKVPARQRSKEYISGAKYLKDNGLLGPKTNLHSGRYISKYAAQKVEEYARAIEGKYTTLKVTKEELTKAKELGFQTARGRVVIPSDKNYVKRVKKEGITAFGVTPIKGGMLEIVVLPHDIFDMRSLAANLENGRLNALKLPEELFAFRYHGHMSFRTFIDTKSLLEYLHTYLSIFDKGGDIRAENAQEEFQAFQLVKLRAIDVGLIPTREARERARKLAKRRRGNQDRREASRNPRDHYEAARLKRYRARQAKAAKERRAKLKTEDASGYLMELQAGKARAIKSRKNKSKK